MRKSKKKNHRIYKLGDGNVSLSFIVAWLILNPGSLLHKIQTAET
jgi:hypothetical protein